MLINTPKTPKNRELLTPYLLLPIGFISLLTVSTLVYWKLAEHPFLTLNQYFCYYTYYFAETTVKSH